jgi:predicted TIM-barrel fold metal-dependent hydrolase
MSFIFSADGHIVEPKDLFTANMPPSLAEYGIRAKLEDDYMVTRAGNAVINRVRLNRAPMITRDGETFGRGNILGASNIEGRLVDMEAEGVDAEIVFPSMGLFTYLVENDEAELATCQIYNDWHAKFFGEHLSVFVRCGLIPVRNFNYAVEEIARLVSLGFTAAMLPAFVPPGMPGYNEDAWDPVFEAGQKHGIVFVLHTGTGRPDVRAEKGPGGAVINYTVQACDAQISVMNLVAGGVLDRFPGAKIAMIESGASWLAGLAERMDEVYEAHWDFVRPKLSVMPSEIIRRQVYASFQYDRACIMSRSVTGHQALMWGSDYPHHEGTFPKSRDVVAKLFDRIDISETEKADILGGNAARLFRLNSPKFAG